jgi:SAM-dependent methyltransferase
MRRQTEPEDKIARLSAIEKRHFWFVARTKILIWIAEKKIGHFASILDVGVRTGTVLEAFHIRFPRIALYGTELCETDLDFARKRLPMATLWQENALDLSCKMGVYDVIGAFDVIEHISEDRTVLRNFARALSKEGVLLLTVPQHKWLWSVIDEQADHERRYTRVELIEKVSECGLKVEYATSFFFFLIPILWAMRRSPLGGKKLEAEKEFAVSNSVNGLLNLVMSLEFWCLRRGWTFPWGGSLLLLARKP